MEFRRPASAARAVPPRRQPRVNILVVDHEPANREAASATFIALGASVIAVDSADRALQILRADPSIALIFIRVELPGMGGILLAGLARRTRPSLSIALTSDQPAVVVPPLYRVIPMPWSEAMLAELMGHAEPAPMIQPRAFLQ